MANNFSKRSILGLCYVCARSPVGLVRGKPSCAACRKFITRHRFANLSSLHCAAGGSNANLCDMTQRRSCAKCRLRRSIELNPVFKREIESHLPKTTQECGNNPTACENHLASLANLRSFITRKNSPTIGGSEFTFSQSDGQCSSDNTVVSLKSSNPDPTSLSSRDQDHVDVVPREDGFLQRDDTPAWIAQLISAMNCIPSTYQVFMDRFICQFQKCTLVESIQLCLLITEQASDPSESFVLHSEIPFSPNELCSAFSMYFDILLDSESNSCTNIIATIRKNAYFAFLTKFPLKVMAQLSRMTVSPTRTT